MLGDVGGPVVGDIATVVNNLPGAGFEEFGQQIEKRGFAGAVRTNQGVNGAGLNLQVDIFDGGKPFEILGQIPGFENNVRLLCLAGLLAHGKTPLSIQADGTSLPGFYCLLLQLFSRKVADTAE